MRVAFKEWAIVVDALGRGEQILIFRKGGIAEGRGGFTIEHPEFLLFPTLFHQQRDSVVPHAQCRFSEIAPAFPPVDTVRLEYFARIVAARQLHSIEEAMAFAGQHIWRDEVVAERFNWGKDKNIFVLALRVFRLRERLEMPMSSRYAGCKSWVELEKDIAIDGAQAVANDDDFRRKIASFEATLIDERPKSGDFREEPQPNS